MTHEELLAEVNKLYSKNPYYKALRAVVELHNPVTIELCDDEDCCGCGDPDFICSECQSNDYPCPTIQAIEKELG